MSRELFAHYCIKCGLEVVEQQVIDWGGETGLDCLSIFQKPARFSALRRSIPLEARSVTEAA
jgi:hypothetical protein